MPDMGSNPVSRADKLAWEEHSRSLDAETRRVANALMEAACNQTYWGSTKEPEAEMKSNRGSVMRRTKTKKTDQGAGPEP